MKKPLILLILVSCVSFGFMLSELSDPDYPTVIGALPEKGPVKPEDSLKVSLGRLLFWDPVLSGTKKVACASCHTPEHGYTDNLDLSIGVNGKGTGYNRVVEPGAEAHFAKRNSQTILNVIFNGMDSVGNYNPAKAPMFWDNRVSSLEVQAIFPITNHDEMLGSAYDASVALDTVVNRLNKIKEYVTLFEKAFNQKNAITVENLTKAIATFEGSLLANNSPFDKYMRGDQLAMTEKQIFGMKMFIINGCTNCHKGPMLSDYKLHVLSAPDNRKLKNPEGDVGANNAYAFRTPSLRNLNYTWPYFHSGTANYLDDAVRFYNTVAYGRSGNPHVQHEQIALDARHTKNSNVPEITAFLDALSDPNYDKKVPARVPSKLPVGGNMN
ncbi:MAG TPA: cytochrome c peroxidase [Cyclobacteriaceae bacterium]|nr:cytochrome c peroxidase [Cyclobacteriaceae bacterium]